MSDCQVEVKRQDILDAGEKRATRRESDKSIYNINTIVIHFNDPDNVAPRRSLQADISEK